MAGPSRGSWMQSSPVQASKRPDLQGLERKPLPNGRCGYRDLSAGPNAPQCGCQRFWGETGARCGTEPSHTCICRHHACYHRLNNIDERTRQDGLSIANSNDSKVRPRVALDESLPSTQSWRESAIRPKSRPQWRSEGHLLLNQSIREESRLTDQAIGLLPPVPAQCLIDSRSALLKDWPESEQDTWDADPLLIRRQAANKRHQDLRRLNTDSERALSTVDEADLNHSGGFALSAEHLNQDAVVSATEKATSCGSPFPEIEYAQDFSPEVGAIEELVGALAKTPAVNPKAQVDPVPKSEAGIGLNKNKEPRSGSEITASQIRILSSRLGAYPRLLQSLHHQADRLERLENASFSYGPIEDCIEKIEFQDGRLIELEYKLEELERWRLSADDQSKAGSFISSSHLEPAMATRGAVSSTSADMISLDRRISEIEQLAKPSATHPLELEVVFLPYNPSLKGLWIDSNAQEGDSPEYRQNVQSLPKHDDDSGKQADVDRSTTAWKSVASNPALAEISTWRHARACGPKQQTYRRLKSRGFVREISLTSNNARDTVKVIRRAFSQVLSQASTKFVEDFYSKTGQDALKLRYQGLSSRIVPLRKNYQDSRLQFLDADEMVSSALWTADFLLSSVVMRSAGSRRTLFVTSPDAYLQQFSGGGTQCTWQNLRQLSTDSLVDAMPTKDDEACWHWNEKLDSVRAASPTLVLPRSNSQDADVTVKHEDISSNSEFFAESSNESSLDDLCQATSPLRREENQESLQTSKIAAFSQRSVASMENEVPRKNSQSLKFKTRRNDDQQALLANKRRRLHSVSPFGFAQPVFQRNILRRLTPKRSKSPSPFGADSGIIMTGAMNGTARGGTPSAYATPHSGIVNRETREQSVDMFDGNDTEEFHTDLSEPENSMDDQEDYSSRDERQEEEGEEKEEGRWEGMGEIEHQQHDTDEVFAQSSQNQSFEAYRQTDESSMSSEGQSNASDSA